MQQLLKQIERNNQDIAYAYLQAYQLNGNPPEQTRILERIQRKKAENADLLYQIQNQINDALNIL